MAKALARAAVERERYRRKRELTPEPRIQHPRLSRSLEDVSPLMGEGTRGSSGASAPTANKSKSIKHRLFVTKDMEKVLARISKARRFNRCEVVGGDTMSRTEWAHAASDYLELT